MFDLTIITYTSIEYISLWLIYIVLLFVLVFCKPGNKALSRSPPIEYYLISNPKLIVKNLSHN